MEAGIASILFLPAKIEKPAVFLFLATLVPGSQTYLEHLSNPRWFEFTIPENFLTPMLGVGYLEKPEQRTLPDIWHPVTIHLMVGILSEKISTAFILFKGNKQSPGNLISWLALWTSGNGGGK